MKTSMSESASFDSVYFDSLHASNSTCSMTGGFARSALALAINAFAISPERCAWRPESSLKVSKMPKVDGPIFSANHSTVPGSASARGNALFRKFSTSASLPGLASTRAKRAYLTMVTFLSGLTTG